MSIELEIVQRGEKQTLQVTERDVIHFPNGLIGCPDWKRFVLLENEDEDLIGLLYCLDEPGVSLLVTDPTRIVPGYRIQLGEADLVTLGADDPSRLDLLTILVVDHERDLLTANLLGPLAINAAASTGAQVVQVDSAYSARHVVASLDTEAETVNRC